MFPFSLGKPQVLPNTLGSAIKGHTSLDQALFDPQSGQFLIHDLLEMLNFLFGASLGHTYRLLLTAQCQCFPKDLQCIRLQQTDSTR